MLIKFGMSEKTQIIDQEGSTMTTSLNYHNGDISPPVRLRCKMKIRVKSQEEELAQYRAFSDELKNDKGMLEPSFSVEHTKHGDEMGYYHIIKAYTRLASEV